MTTKIGLVVLARTKHLKNTATPATPTRAGTVPKRNQWNAQLPEHFSFNKRQQKSKNNSLT